MPPTTKLVRTIIVLALAAAVVRPLGGQDRRPLSGGEGEAAKKTPAAKRLAVVGGFPDWVVSVAFSPDGRLLAAGSYEVVKLIEVPGGKVAATLQAESGLARSLAFSPDGRLLAVGSYQSLRLWRVGRPSKADPTVSEGRRTGNAASHRPVRTLEGHRAYVTGLAFSPDGKRLASSSEDESVRVWDVAEGRELLGIREFRYPVQSVAFSPDGRLLATASGDPDRVNRTGHVRVWDAATGKEKLWTVVDEGGNEQTGGLVVHLKAASDVAFSPDGRLLASAGFDEKVNIYDLQTGQALGYFAGHSRPTAGVVFAPGGETVISGSGGRFKGRNEVKIWNRADGEELAGWEAHKERITALALSPDGRTLATASYDKTAALWDVGPLVVADLSASPGDKSPATNNRVGRLPVEAARPRDGQKNCQGSGARSQGSGAGSQGPEAGAADHSPLTTHYSPGHVVAVDPPVDANQKSLRAGIIGLDTSHVIAFTRVLNDPKAKPDVAGCRVVAAYPQGSPDIESSVSRVPKYTRQIREMGVEIVGSIPELLERVDVVLLETNDGRPHLEQALPVLKAGKPVFIDKPLAGSLADAVAIFEAARRYKTPVFSSSSLRYGPGSQAARAGRIGRIVKAETYSPCALEPTHPDLFWYGIHGVEALFTVMGPGCESVTRTTSTPEMDVVVGQWAGDRTGTFRGYRQGRRGYGGVAVGTKGKLEIGQSAGYRPLVVEIVKFFRTGKPPVSEKETLEIYAFMEAADESKRRGMKEVSLAKVLQQARKEAKARLAELEW